MANTQKGTWQIALKELLEGVDDLYIHGAHTNNPTITFADKSKGKHESTKTAGKQVYSYVNVLTKLREKYPNETSVNAKLVFERLTQVEGFKGEKRGQGFFHLQRGDRAKAGKAATSKGFGGSIL